MAETLTIGIAIGPNGPRAWEAAMLRELSNIPGIAATLLQFDNADDAPAPLAYRLFERFDNAVFGLAKDPLAIVPLDSGLPRPRAEASTLARFDLLVVLTDVAARQAQAIPMGRLGALTVVTLDAEGRDCQPPGYWEVMRSVPVTRIGVRWLTADGGNRLVLHSCSSTADFSPRRNREPLFWKAHAFIPRLLRRLDPHRLDPDNLFPEVLPERPDPSWVEAMPPASTGGICHGALSLAFETTAAHAPGYGYPRIATLAHHLARKTPDLFRFYHHAKLTREQWFLMFRFSEHPTSDLTQFTPILPPTDRIWADPHIMKYEGRHYVFIEEMLFKENKGFISVLTIDEDGRHSQPVKVLERDYHLSYPQVFEYRGEIYMLPETSGNRTIELYRCERFPDRWTLETVIMDDIDAVDSSLLFDNGRWWLFCSIKPHPAASENDELHLFHSDDLLSGNWRPHPENPVISDVRFARPAGKPYRHLGRRIRPSQNCSGIYGYGFNLNVITRLDENRYREEPLVSVNAGQHPGLIGTHTYAREGRLTVVDACRRISHPLI